MDISKHILIYLLRLIFVLGLILLLLALAGCEPEKQKVSKPFVASTQAMAAEAEVEESDVKYLGYYKLKTPGNGSWLLTIYVYEVTINGQVRELHWNGSVFRECSFGVLATGKEK